MPKGASAPSLPISSASREGKPRTVPSGWYQRDMCNGAGDLEKPTVRQRIPTILRHANEFGQAVKRLSFASAATKTRDQLLCLNAAE